MLECLASGWQREECRRVRDYTAPIVSLVEVRLRDQFAGQPIAFHLGACLFGMRRTTGSLSQSTLRMWPWSPFF